MSRPLTEEEEEGVRALIEAVRKGQVTERAVERARWFAQSQITSWLHSARAWRQFPAREEMYQNNRDHARRSIRNTRVTREALARLTAKAPRQGRAADKPDEGRGQHESDSLVG